MKVILPDFRRASVLVIGDIMLDRYWYGFSDRISPEAPVPIVKIDTTEERPGGAANVAMNIAELGSCVHLIGLTGIDDAACTLNTKLTQVNVTCDFIAIKSHPTIIKLRVISRNQQLTRFDFEKKFENIDLTCIMKRIQFALQRTNIVVLSDYAKGTLVAVNEIITLARTAGIPVLVDPKGADFSRYQTATLLTPNLSEFEAVVGSCPDEQTLVNRGLEIINDYHLSALLITRSEQGMTLLQPGKYPLHLATQAQEVYDVTGAGDTVIGVLAAALGAGNSLESSCMLANAATGVVVGKLGTSSVSLLELDDAIHGCIENSFGVMSESTLKQAVMLARKRGDKIVMTNGVFDILHPGHIHYLTSASQKGNRLIIAVNNDESTKRLKGKNRPINSLEQRMAVLAALEMVDWVVPFNEDTPQRLIADILPDVLVKGGDYKEHEIAGSEDVWNNGGDVIVINFKHGFSTTSIVDAIKKKNLNF
ncbi:D-heptose-7- phosphate 1-kinase,D-heptose-1-phosphate adenylyltransferase [secondary endosymbiont of Heteropsylla cubana]|uniref:Bifunctional protein HldE n=1 Tax=secondary endosymbiont of Heteropsylla cubana TaxID=134287 RepID=J3TGE3_9ENTR|nr:bifunctional D-glycero-beta-D-manno-heptose-7-phosphate kinase/D-glycero-beta-D-manno-heptose 1-phosphate adenylyltransferase HldE [secondary endosymbiont of Heteropsylla cubana]AFP85487.1 D-heptose-7- phosphate 1-kinase,D-heptose-1-phosphate adenylyltransferase [secondary endosymbiont of Heteropsylla cubana]